MQKLEKALLAISNMETAINDIKSKDKNDIKNPLKDVSFEAYKEYIIILDKILNELDGLKYEEMVKHNRIDEIRSIWHSIVKLVPEEDYHKFHNELTIVFNSLNAESKKEDDKKIERLERLFDKLPKKTKNRITYATITSTGKVKQNGHSNNFKVVTRKYKDYKYYSKNVKNEETIENDMDDISRLETVIYALNKISRICKNGKYHSLISLVNEYLKKYQTQLDDLKKEKNHKFKDAKKVEKVEVTDTINTAMELTENDNSFGINM